MSLIEINLGLRRALLRYPTAELLNSPYSVAAILSLSHDALQAFVRHANAEAGETSEACLSDAEMEKISSVYAELINSFFPMAHTDRPIQELQIIELRRAENFRGMLGELMHLHEHARALSEEMRRIAQRTEDLHRRCSDEFHQLINP